MANPSKDHLHYAKYVFKYLVSTKELRLKYDGLSQAGLIGFSDSDWGENKDDRHSTSGNVFMMANCAITWMCRRQKVVATSVGEAEYMELSDTAKQCAWLRSFAHEINFSPTKGTPLCADNQAAIFIATNKAIDRRTKHIDIRYHFVREELEKEKIELFHIAGAENPADLFTKPLPHTLILKFRDFIGLVDYKDLD